MMDLPPSAGRSTQPDILPEDSLQITKFPGQARFFRAFSENDRSDLIVIQLKRHLNMNQPLLTFDCDAMLGDASWRADISDWELIRTARYEDRTVLTSDTGIMLRGVIRDGEVPALFVPHGLGVLEQLAFVLQQLHLPVREARCMACGGVLVEISKDQVQERVPPRRFAWVDQFWECERCRRAFWQGTHWPRILDQLHQACRAPPRIFASDPSSTRPAVRSPFLGICLGNDRDQERGIRGRTRCPPALLGMTPFPGLTS
jgi:uncharacterized protein with PIN domain